MSSEQRTFPAIKTFTIRSLGWEFVDLQTVSRRERTSVIRIWAGHVSALLSRVGLDPDLFVCANNGPEWTKRRTRRWVVALEADENLDYSEWKEAGGEAEFDWESDGVRGFIVLGIRDRTGWVGALLIKNIDVEVEDRDKITIAAIMFPGAPAAGELSVIDTWVEVIRYIINDVEMDLADGRKLDIVQNNWNTSPDTRALYSTQPELNSFVTKLGAVFDSKGATRVEEGNMKFRRRGATPERIR